MSEFVEGWSILQVLGEGGYGEVKLLYNRNTGSAVAMKTIDLVKHAQKITEVRREAYIHNLLSHENIIRYYGQRQERNFVYMFLEYASGGDLFDLIEPDVGMPQSEARNYFMQLISGVEYLHSKGIAHRDLKPENLLLDGNGNLKISDFGLATIFRHQNKERLLQKQCGTLQYIAPEIFIGPYAAESADVWSCGIILIAMLAGELPWIRADSECPMYIKWRKNRIECIKEAPWSKISKSAFSIIERILNLNPVKRYTIANIKAHRWCKLQSCQSAISIDVVDHFGRDTSSRLCYSQPVEMEVIESDESKFNKGFSFSQPTHIEDLLVSTQLMQSQSSSPNMDCLDRLVKRMTRFFVKVSTREIMDRLRTAVDKLGYKWNSYCEGVVTISSKVSRYGDVIFKVNILNMPESILLDFRLSSGCGLEFKKCFIALKRELNDLINKELPISDRNVRV